MAKRFLSLFLFVLMLLFLGRINTVLGDVSSDFGQAVRDTRNGYYEQAEAVYTRIVAENAGSDDAFTSLRKLPCLYVALDRQSEAQAAFEKMLDDFSGHERLPHAVHEVVQGCHEFGKADKGRQLCESVLSSRTISDEAVWLQMGVAISDNYLGDDEAVESSLEIFKTEYAEDDRSAEALGQIAWSCRNLKKYGKAREIYQYVVDFWPNKDRAIFSKRGVVLSNISLGYHEEAWATFEELIAQYSQDEHAAEVISHLARTYGRLKQHEKARTLHQYVADNYLESELAIQSQTNATLSSIALRDDADIQADIDKLYSRFSNDPGIAQAVYFVARKVDDYDYEKADGLYRYIIDNHPDDDYALLAGAKTGAISIWREDLTGAQTVLDGLLADFSGHPFLPQAVSVIADGYYEMAIHREEDAFDEQTEWYYQKTIAECERIVNELPEAGNTTAEACYFVGFCNGRLGEYDKSRTYYLRLVDNWPDFKYAWNALYRIGRDREDLVKSRVISRSEADPIIRDAYEQMLEMYPSCAGAKHVRRWLDRNRPTR